MISPTTCWTRPSRRARAAGRLHRADAAAAAEQRAEQRCRTMVRPGASHRGRRCRAAAPLQPGMHVQHPTWGEGMVLNTNLQDGDEIVDIYFAEIGLKRVVASLARLEIKV